VNVYGNALRKQQRIEIDDILLQPSEKEALDEFLLNAVKQILLLAGEKEERELKKAAGGLIPPGK